MIPLLLSSTSLHNLGGGVVVTLTEGRNLGIRWLSEEGRPFCRSFHTPLPWPFIYGVINLTEVRHLGRWSLSQEGFPLGLSLPVICRLTPGLAILFQGEMDSTLDDRTKSGTWTKVAACRCCGKTGD